MTGTSRFVDVEGGRLHYKVDGSGPPVVLIHEGIGDMRMWEPQLDAISVHHRLVRYDVRGFGESSIPTGDYSLHEDMRTLFDALAIDRAAVLGASLGGTIAIDFTLAYPERVTALIAVATNPNGYDRWGDDIKRQWQEESEALARGDLDRAVEINLTMWVDGPKRTPDEVDPKVREAVREMLAHNLPRTGEGEPQDLEPLAVGRLEEITATTLVLYGDKDMPEIIAACELLAESIPGARKHVVVDVAHALMVEKPEEFNRVVLEFLASVT